ncbi:MAG: hypothetical protein IT292_12190 [Deltaproteobacteria bacterium]|nr:hypothetical protein [Deltaproteobacteria bacterium]
MAFELSNATPTGSTATVKYDTDKVLLVGSYSDELSAYRAKRSWLDILAAHFTLEKGRDYDLNLVKPCSEKEINNFTLTCSFHSACGRYAFWRLINGQSPEAENKLGLSRKNKSQHEKLLSAIFGYETKSSVPAWIMSCETRRPRRLTSLLKAARHKLSCLLF